MCLCKEIEKKKKTVVCTQTGGYTSVTLFIVEDIAQSDEYL